MDTEDPDISTAESDGRMAPVGYRLLAMLDQHERNAAWLARKTGKSPAYVTRVMQGKRRPSDDFKARASEALSVPVALLFPEVAA